jgi:hypothetical protein
MIHIIIQHTCGGGAQTMNVARALRPAKVVKRTKTSVAALVSGRRLIMLKIYPFNAPVCK